MSGSMFNLTPGAMGGTEMMALRVEKIVREKAPGLLDFNWIIAPGSGRLVKDKKNIVWMHLAPDSRDVQVLNDPSFMSGIDAFVFVSHWQHMQFLKYFRNIDSSRCFVVPNAIDPIKKHKKPSTKKAVNLIFHSEAIRGLPVLLDAIDLIGWNRIHLDVYGEVPFSIDNPNVTLHGRVSNKKIRKGLKKAHIFAYPSTVEETSCLALMEAMSAGCAVLTNNLGALAETGMGLTQIYPIALDHDEHVRRCADELDRLVAGAGVRNINLAEQIALTNKAYSWEHRSEDWVRLEKRLCFNPANMICRNVLNIR